jgi:hypothetical protein
MTDLAIPVATLILSLAAFITAQVSSYKTANKDYVRALEGRIDRLETDNTRLQTELDKCTQIRDQQAGEIIVLMRKLISKDEL